ncbi:uncharacterized protein LOC111269154 isoform X3 [Varroa jacobsoni]|uniref:uncharacterized protein LOC111269154 isoform X3 n=1 Tax=Varroa jacobsoni TaxID=62625 RepID=UPI000BFAAED9|nr:uncharacterized protein LOC111269154 isoform X3 [Varroa jacobsoni]
MKFATSSTVMLLSPPLLAATRMALMPIVYLLSVWQWADLPVGGVSMTYPSTQTLPLNTPTALSGTQLPPLLILPNTTLYTVFDEVTTYTYEADTMITWQEAGLQSGVQKSNTTPHGTSFFETEAWNSTESVVTVGQNMEQSGSRAYGSSGGLDWEMVSAPSEDGSTFQQVLLGVGLYTLSLLTLAGNTMVLHAIRTERRLQTVV